MFEKIKKKVFFWQNPTATDQELILNRHRIYIMPNRSGLVYALILLTIFITSINYNLNLGYALDFILISCGWLGIHLTYRNLSGIGLLASPGQAVFSGELAHLPVHLNNPTARDRYAIFIGFAPHAMQAIDLPGFCNVATTLAITAQQRGWMSCPKIRVHTTFPYGLLTAWSYWKTTQKMLVFPKPEPYPPPLPYLGGDASGTELFTGNDEFSGIRNYRSGDSLKQLAWRQMARQSAAGNDALLSKHFEGGQQKIGSVDMSLLPLHYGLEQKLSCLCAWVLMAEKEHIRYAFSLGPVHYPENSGEDHQRACLTALALYGQTE